ncbi:MAG: CDGSH iron-sulfur domain-containing protein [Methylococcaceae bacterium]|nr:CDGSH iron-sulfur domain-containing protein [Methylococcaceae bacterium]MDP3902720.1 CDGSH iron-sulfur domain-containing protein [Methylococcaceae bacterium]
MTHKTNAPIAVEVIAGEKYAWCSCGLSATMPLCDGAHKIAETEKRSLKFFPEESGTVMLCACTKTQNPPYCDGSHCQ